MIPNGRDPGTYHPPTGDETPRRATPCPLRRSARAREAARPVPRRRRGAALAGAVVRRGRGRRRTAARGAGEPCRGPGGRRCSASAPMSRTCSVRASVLVMTSAAATEGMPGVLIEAGLSGLPVVSTRAAGVADVVVDGETGFVARHGRPRGPRRSGRGPARRRRSARRNGQRRAPALRGRVLARCHRCSAGATSSQSWRRGPAAQPPDGIVSPCPGRIESWLNEDAWQAFRRRCPADHRSCGTCSRGTGAGWPCWRAPRSSARCSRRSSSS